MFVKKFIICCVCFVFSFEVFAMEENLISQQKYDSAYGSLIIAPIARPASFYAADREVLDNVRYPGHIVHVQKCLDVFATLQEGCCYFKKTQALALYNCITHQQAIDITNVMFHTILIDTENGHLDVFLSVETYPHWKQTREYLSKIAQFDGEAVNVDLWTRIAINLTAVKNVKGSQIWRSEYTDYSAEILHVIDATTDWPTEHYLSWAIKKAKADMSAI